jgi:hypothetical protein
MRRHGVPRKEGYADAGHLSYTSCQAMRGRFVMFLKPDQMDDRGVRGIGIEVHRKVW